MRRTTKRHRTTLRAVERAVAQPAHVISAKWPANLRRSLALAGVEHAQETAEQRERQRWLVELRAIIRACDLPVVHSMNPNTALLSVGQVRRARTIRKRVRDCGKLMRCWFIDVRALMAIGLRASVGVLVSISKRRHVSVHFGSIRARTALCGMCRRGS